MALLGQFTKQPREVLDCSIDYEAALTPRTLTITSQTTEVAPAGLTVANVIRNGANTAISFTVSGGSDGTLYKVTILATCGTLVFEDEVNVLVEEV